MSQIRRAIAIALLAAVVLPISLSTTHANERTTYQTANAVNFMTGVPVGGAGTLYRTANSLRLHVATSGLDADAAYTVWWVIWSNPSVCSGACGEDDLGKRGNSVFYATGFVTGNDGVANVGAQVDAGALPPGVDVLIPGGLEPGQGLRAEVHVVIRSHGAIVPGMVAKQISTFDADCAICADQQAIVFAPGS